jgi:hypothetical protein
VSKPAVMWTSGPAGASNLGRRIFTPAFSEFPMVENTLKRAGFDGKVMLLGDSPRRNAFLSGWSRA